MKFFKTLLLFNLLIASSFGQAIQSAPTLKDQFTKKIGNLRMSTSTLSFGKVFTNESKQDTIKILNAGTAEMQITIQTKADYLNAQLSSPVLAVGQEGWVVISYNFGKRNEYGFILDRILINTNDKDQPQKNINVTATISEYFPSSTDSLAPKAKITETSYNYGTIHQGEKTNHDFTISNQGVNPLLIRKMKCTCGCIKVGATKSEIKTGESAIIHVDFDSFGKEGKDDRIINIYLNDPILPEIKLEMSGYVGK